MVVSIGDWILTHFFMWNDFDASRKGRVKKKKVSVKGAKQAVIFYPYWTGKSSFYKGFAKKFPDATHIFYDYPNEVYSENVDVSLNYILEILSDSVRLIGELRREGIEEIVLVGSSFGSNIAFKLATMIKVEKVVLNMMDRDFANAIFKSPALGLLRKKLEYQGFTLSKLQKVYKFISIDTHVKNIKGKNTKFLFFVSVSDIFTPARKFKPFFRKLERLKIDYNVYTNYFLGHVFGMYRNINSSRMQHFVED